MSIPRALACRSVSERVDRRAALDEEPGHARTALSDCVVELGTDRSARGLQVGADDHERDGHLNVVGAGRKVQRRPGAIPLLPSLGSAPVSMSTATAAKAAGE